MASNENINFLTEMGFSRARAEQAVKATPGQDLQAAIEWMESHPEDSNNQDAGQLPQEFGESEKPMDVQGNASETTADETEKGEGDKTNNADSATPVQQALSLVCEECGKQLRSELDAQAHATRTGHQQFAESSVEIKPLTEEEKKQQVELLQKKMAERRKEREEIEKEEAKKRERIRRKTGKELTEAKQKHEIEEIKRIAEERKREKHEERLYRQKLKQKIAQDRANMKAAQQSTSQPAASSQPPPVVKPETQPQQTKEYETCRIQLRFPNGTTSTGNFKPDDALSTVYEYATANGYDGLTPPALMTTFPRKTFTQADMQVTLKDLGLVPSSVIIVKNS